MKKIIKPNLLPKDISKISRKPDLQTKLAKSISYPGVYVEEVPSGVRTISGVETSIVAFIGQASDGPVDEPVSLSTFAEFENVFGGLQAGLGLGYSVRDFFLNGGSRAIVARVGDHASPLMASDFVGPGKLADKSGLYALDRVDLFNLLVIPPYTGSGDVDTSVISEAAVYCERRRAFLILDPPAAWSNVSMAVAGISQLGTTSKNASVYFPRIRQSDPLQGNVLTTFAPAGAIAGIYARTDANRGVWKAPAGTEATLVGVPELASSISEQNCGQLNSLGINCLRALPSLGRVVWGSRTLQGNDSFASEWKYVPVRRTALFIEESLYRGTVWAVFEPNNETLWAQLRLAVNAFMHELFRRGAFQGSTAKEAYFVKCDHDTTTLNDIRNGLVNLMVGFAPLKPADFVVLKIQQKAGSL